ncbi:hypothetical protein [Streptomyces sp. NPDC057694]|uniref:hypothetical protein n=1 Tax=Streptomyces sp. NPDC057694 TaxID=3346216 RepID=UPI0036B87AAF
MTDEHAHTLGEALAAAVRPRQADGTSGERQALAAFRAARDAGALTAPPRRRDDWRPRRGRARWSARAAVGAVVASLAVGGVAVAGIGTVTGPDTHRERSRPAPATTTSPAPAPAAPRTTAPAKPTTGVLPPRPEQADDEQARCKSYENGHGLNRSERAAEGCATPSVSSPAPGNAGAGHGSGKTPPGLARGHDKD